MSNLHFSICALFVSTLLLIVFFYKKRINNNETKIFSVLLVANFMDAILMTTIVSLGYFEGNYDNFAWVLNKIDFLFYLIWARYFFLYIFYVSFDNSKYHLISKITLMINIVSLIAIILLPLYLKNENNIMYSYGPSVTLLYCVCCFYAVLIVLCVLRNVKRINNKKYIPLFASVIMMLIMLVVRNYNPSLLIIPAIIAYIDLIMFFTIENPDMKLLEEVKMAKDRVEKYNEDKTDFIFNITSGIKETLNDLDRNIDLSFETTDPETIKNNLNSMKNIINSSKVLLYRNLNITENDVKKIELMNNKYNIRNLLKEVISFNKKDIKDGIDFRVDIENGIPEYLYGDSIKLKQILTTILDNSVRHTDSGFIEISVKSIIKYDVCRLLITLEDSGRGMSNEMIDDILKKDDLDRKYISKNLDLKSVNKIINIIGGTFNITSKINSGTKVMITLDQKMDEEKKNNINDYLKKLNKHKVLLVDDNFESIDQTKKILEKQGIYVDSVIWGEQCLNKIRNKEKFDLIIMNYDIPKLNGVEVFNRLKKIPNFNIPVIILTINDDLKVKEKYKELGFFDIMPKALRKEDIKIIVDYLQKNN